MENKCSLVANFRPTIAPKYNFLVNNVKYLKKFIYFCGVKTNQQRIMDGLIKELLEYLKNTPEDQKRKDWEALAGYGRLGPSVSDYLTYLLGGVPQMEIKNNSKIPEYSLEFCF